jgi:ribonuclease-3
MSELFSDYKTALQEVTQAYFGSIPVYKLESAIGPDHEKEFELSLWINDKHYATATGKSKKLAQQASAKIVLNQLTGRK